MNNAGETREFLTSRRAEVTPEQVGLPRYGRHRRVSGVRREEVALLANIRVEYDTRLERGSGRGVSDEVLESVSRALRLDEAEHAPRSISSGLPARSGAHAAPRRLSWSGRASAASSTP